MRASSGSRLRARRGPNRNPRRRRKSRHASPSHRYRASARLAPGRSGGSAAAARPVVLHVALRTARSARPVWDRADGRALTTLPLNGNGTSAASGNGAGTQGNGNGAANGGQPCGFVTFSDPHGSQFDRHTHGFWVDIRMSVQLADGSRRSLILDYPWYYPSEAANPWSMRISRIQTFRCVSRRRRRVKSTASRNSSIRRRPQHDRWADPAQRLRHAVKRRLAIRSRPSARLFRARLLSKRRDG